MTSIHNKDVDLSLFIEDDSSHHSSDFDIPLHQHPRAPSFVDRDFIVQADMSLE
jgi:hypothetical protein